MDLSFNKTDDGQKEKIYKGEMCAEEKMSVKDKKQSPDDDIKANILRWMYSDWSHRGLTDVVEHHVMCL